jgi:hypothetical protein
MVNFIEGLIVLILGILIFIYVPWFMGKVIVYVFKLDKSTASGLTGHVAHWCLGVGVFILAMLIIAAAYDIGERLHFNSLL